MLSSLLADAKIFLSLVIISIFLIILDNLNFLNFPKSTLQQITIPIQYGLYKTGLNIGSQFEFIILARRSSKEYKVQSEQLANLLSENANLRKKLAETQSFIDQSKTLNDQTFSMVATRPLGIARYLLIDKGTNDGLKINQAVVYKDNFIGLIKEVSPKKSKVILSTDPDSKISAFVDSVEGKAKGVLKGQFGSEMLMEKILHQEPLKIGDLVYSEGTEVEIPRGLVLGQVSEVSGADNEIFKQAKVKQIFDPANVEVFFVVTN